MSLTGLSLLIRASFRSVSILQLLLFLFLPALNAQTDFAWWNQKHNWDGITHWQYYLIPSPGFFGPNALPIPELFPGRIDSQYTIELAGELHFRRQNRDNTQNLFFRAYFPLFSKRVGLNLEMVPLEWYETDTLLRDERRSRERVPQGTAVGDLNIGTFIQILTEKGWRPDLMLRLNLRTASGNKLSGARFLDSPGYFFDLTAGKSFRSSNPKAPVLRAYLMAGFYVYQSSFREQEQRQNDCFLFGAGLDLEFPFLRLQNQLTGYSGYLGNRDRITAYRLRLRSRFKGPLQVQVQYQYGFQNWAYQSARLSTLLTFDR